MENVAESPKRRDQITAIGDEIIEVVGMIGMKYVNRSSKRVGLAEKNSEISGVNGEEWDWECWKKHFTEVEEEERLISVSEIEKW
ncbi:hypothetical protein T459_35237 [Capsicum annuum]|uniref:Uncharacterized protein n=1 Tax=Capsicum annuum TaxID=4072 RepID=A0A2G2XTV6_CAPAN|nr:hypothetical protein T459_35237 [Capsicum annuum]